MIGARPLEAAAAYAIGTLISKGRDNVPMASPQLMASTRTVTPLAIGVFGPWGSGKTFFMRHLQRRIVGIRRDEHARIKAWLAKRYDRTARPEDAPLYFGVIAQVEFNAWHYNEGMVRNDEMKAVELQNARFDGRIKKLDISLKEFELQHKLGFWRSVLASPAFLAGLIAVLATLATASVSLIIASQQRDVDAKRNELQVQAERDKNEGVQFLERLKYQANLLSTIVLAAKGDSCQLASQLSAIAGAQAFTDPGFRSQVDRMLNLHSRQCKTDRHEDR